METWHLSGQGDECLLGEGCAPGKWAAFLMKAHLRWPHPSLHPALNVSVISEVSDCERKDKRISDTDLET